MEYKERKVLVIGLDSAAPDLVFDRFKDELPNLKLMAEEGVYGRLRSCHPPITIPAWITMATGVNPGKLGLYGFRHRKNNSYTEISLPTSRSVKERRVWDYIGDAGRKVCVVGVPPSYPPQRVNGWMVSCMMTPSAKSQYTYPRGLRDEVERVAGEYVFDVAFRKEDREGVLRDIYDMTEKHFKVVEYLIAEKPWSFFMFVEIGLDRIQHAFWRFFDEEHHLYEPSKFKNVVKDYYKYLDEKIGRILSMIDDDTAVLVVSDHGAKRMKGAFCVNEWLIREGYLKVKGGKATRGVNDCEPGVAEPEEVDVDWEHTKAWAWGGYYARVFINLRGREEKGAVKPSDYDRVRDELAEKLKGIRGPRGEKWNTSVYKPEELYPVCNGSPPDLIVYFDDLSWRSAGTIGHKTLYLAENDRGPDDAVHDYDGVFILYDPRRSLGGRRVAVDILDVAPTILKLMGLPVPATMEGRPVEGV